MRRVLEAAALTLLLLALPLQGKAEDDVPALIVSAALAHGVNPNWMLRTARCESHYDRYAVSPDGANIGLFQLNRYGKLLVFYARGYDDPWDPSQQANFTAEQFAAGQSGAWPNCA